jgi:hypothetical protein
MKIPDFGLRNDYPEPGIFSFRIKIISLFTY